MKIFRSHSLEETRELATGWLQSLAARPFGESSSSPPACRQARQTPQDGNSLGATVVGMSGHLGAGKTAFVKIVAKLLGVKEEVTSPTFVIMKIYELDPNSQFPISNSTCPWKRLVHIDAYRLERAEELEVLNFDRLVADPGHLIMIEWPENVELDKVLPDHHRMKFEVVEGEYRMTTIE
ncbi:MAG: tRNA (adenosine(37)-N6)-threonylcarbamoyltransferase complex ATPase subunit type 1 TsaE [Candidatus Taylorbacteria bacterium]